MSKILTDEEIIEELLREDDDESVGGYSDSEDDNVEESEHDTDSDISAASGDETVGMKNDSFFLGRDGKTKWNKHPFSQRGRAKKHNIVATHIPGAQGTAKGAKTPEDTFFLYFDENIIDRLVLYTNMYIMKIATNFERTRDAQVTDRIEMKAFLGILLFAGTYRASHLHFTDMWGQDGPEIFSLTMSYQRFLFLLRSIRFDNTSDRDERKKSDKLAAIREFLELIRKNFKDAYTPAEYLTIDEQLIPFRGRCSFRQYLPKKPKKYGIKVFALVDSRSFYLHTFDVYAGLQPDGPFKQSNTPSDVVQRLVAHITNSGRNITVDNWYTSVPLARTLLDMKLTLVGTLRKNKREIPAEFLPDKQKNVKSSLFGFTKEMCMVSYVPRKSYSVVLISSMHSDAKIAAETGADKKPEIVTFYNCTKGGVDTCDQLCSNYSVARRTRRWPLAVFFHFLNVSALNAYIIYKMNTSKKIQRRIFLKELANKLIMESVVRRAGNSHVSRNVRERIKLFLTVRGIEVPQQQQQHDRCHQTNEEARPGHTSYKRKRCHICPSTNDNKHSTVCDTCMEHVCKVHSKIVCTNCLAD